MTNANRIRNMSDKELEVFLTNVYTQAYLDGHEDGDTELSFAEWLQRECVGV